MERGKVLAFCGPYFMNFLALHVFADVSVELNFVGKKRGLSGYLRLTLNCLPKGDFKRGFQGHPCSCCVFGCCSPLPDWPSARGASLQRAACVLCSRTVQSHEKCCSDDSDLG